MSGIILLGFFIQGSVSLEVASARMICGDDNVRD
jgi:hypothetical protein